MIKLNEMIVDDTNDWVSELLVKLNKRNTWNQECKNIIDTIVEKLQNNGYISFQGPVDRYHLSRVGDVCLYHVPLNRRGHLSKFRGQLIRLICVGSGRYKRDFMAGPVRKF